MSFAAKDKRSSWSCMRSWSGERSVFKNVQVVSICAPCASQTLRSKPVPAASGDQVSLHVYMNIHCCLSPCEYMYYMPCKSLAGQKVLGSVMDTTPILCATKINKSTPYLIPTPNFDLKCYTTSSNGPQCPTQLCSDTNKFERHLQSLVLSINVYCISVYGTWMRAWGNLGENNLLSDQGFKNLKAIYRKWVPKAGVFQPSTN